MSDSARIRLTRTQQWFGRFRGLAVLVDGEKRARLRCGQTVELEVPAGEHVVQVAMDWCRSTPLSVDCAPGSVHGFTCVMPGAGQGRGAVVARPGAAFLLVPDREAGA